MPHKRTLEAIVKIMSGSAGSMPADDAPHAMPARAVLRELLPVIATGVPSLYEMTGPGNPAHGDNPHPKGSNFLACLPDVLTQYAGDAWKMGVELRYQYQWYWPHTGDYKDGRPTLYDDLQREKLTLLRQITYDYQYHPVRVARTAVDFCRAQALCEDAVLARLDHDLAQANLLAA